MTTYDPCRERALRLWCALFRALRRLYRRHRRRRGGGTSLRGAQRAR